MNIYKLLSQYLNYSKPLEKVCVIPQTNRYQSRSVARHSVLCCEAHGISPVEDITNFHHDALLLYDYILNIILHLFAVSLFLIPRLLASHFSLVSKNIPHTMSL